MAVPLLGWVWRGWVGSESSRSTWKEPWTGHREAWVGHVRELVGVHIVLVHVLRGLVLCCSAGFWILFGHGICMGEFVV